MGECPFCHAEIPERLLLYGGACPSCLNEIPGEETATNPGISLEEVAGQEETPSGKSMPVAAIAAGLLAVCAVAFLMWPKPEEPIEYEEVDFYIEPIEFSSMEPVETQEPSQQATATPRLPQAGEAKAPAGEAAEAEEEEIVDPLADNQEEEVPDRLRADPGEREQAQTQAEKPKVNLGGSALGGPSIAPKLEAASLSDPGLIQKMIKDTIGSYQSEIQGCLKLGKSEDSQLKGTWSLDLTIQKSGKVTDVSARGLNMSNATLESCMVQKASAWKFRAITTPQKIRLPFRLR